jgi:transposase-like protein
VFSRYRAQRRVQSTSARPNRSWRVDETYVRVPGRWTYLYRAIDSKGDTIDVMLSPNRDAIAAKHFLRLALASRITALLKGESLPVSGSDLWMALSTPLRATKRCT